MGSFNAICGLPRSGSTLLCNVLNQHPQISCSSTSPLSIAFASVIHALGSAEETKSFLIQDSADTQERITRALGGLITGWYAGDKTEHVFDKGRGWAFCVNALQQIEPEALVIALVRDPRDVVASVLKRDAETPLLDRAATSLAKTMYAKAEELMSPDGIVGSCILGVEDMLRGKHKAVSFYTYEFFVREPLSVLTQVLERLTAPPFDFNTENVKNTAEDIDGLYLNKFPHEGSGKISADKIGVWRTVLDDDLAEAIRSRYPFYCKTFGY
jgi:sulfotransferase